MLSISQAGIALVKDFRITPLFFKEKSFARSGIYPSRAKIY